MTVCSRQRWLIDASLSPDYDISRLYRSQAPRFIPFKPAIFDKSAHPLSRIVSL
jgi:hypothetical protein